MALVHTIGHSTRSADELLALLAEHEIDLLVDVRRFPASRRHPQFAREALAAALAAAGIAYRHEPDLGGRRQPRPDSANTAWRVAAFRGYADHMETAEFAAALGRLMRLAGAGAPAASDAPDVPDVPPMGRPSRPVENAAGGSRVAILCAEAVPWRCHRRLIADALVARGVEVRHILGPGASPAHAIDANARVLAGGRLLYDGGAGSLPFAATPPR